MSSKKVLIHVGFHKSGTTALQESLYLQREALLERGISYPNIKKKAHHRLAWALTQRAWGWKNRGGERTPVSVWERTVKQINSSKAETVVLSSEFFSELKPEKIEKIKRDISSREVTILFTIRPLAKLLGSSYQQYLKYGTKADYESWLHSVLDEPGVSKVNPTFWMRHMHGEVITKWAKVFGVENICVVVVDESKPELLFDAVNQILGVEKLLQPQETGSNRSLSVEEISLLLEINKLFPKEREWNEYLTFVRNGLIRELTDHIPVKPGQEKLLTPEWAVTKANSLAAASKEIIRNLGVRVYGDIESLDSASVPTGNPVYSSSIDIETMAKVLLTFNRAIIKRFPIRWLLADLKRRVVFTVKRKSSD